MKPTRAHQALGIIRESYYAEFFDDYFSVYRHEFKCGSVLLYCEEWDNNVSIGIHNDWLNESIEIDKKEHPECYDNFGMFDCDKTDLHPVEFRPVPEEHAKFGYPKPKTPQGKGDGND